MPREDLIEAWSSYWRTGRAASCTLGAEEVGFEPLWREFFDSFTNADLLDLGTGNGAVVHGAASSARGRNARLRLTGIDAAQIQAAVPETDSLVARFLSGVVMEALPFAAESFDGVSAQYAFEYAEEAAAAAELARVLRPGGRFRLIVHAREGRVRSDVELRVSRLRLVLADDGLLSVLERAARAHAAGDAEDAGPAVADAATRARTLALYPPAEDAALFYANGLSQLWDARGRYRPDDLLHAIEDALSRARAIVLRQEALLAAARSAKAMERMRARLEGRGLSVAAPAPVRGPDGEMLAWRLDGAQPI